MTQLKYKVITSKTRYKEYVKKLEDLLLIRSGGKNIQDEVDLLTVLIEKWDREHNTFNEVDPIRLLHSFMDDHKLKPKDLVKLLGVSKGYVSEILHYKKGLSKEVIRNLADHFKVSQEAFNRPYILVSPSVSTLKNRRIKKGGKQHSLSISS